MWILCGNGKLSVIYDAEILSIIYSTFKNLGFEDVYNKNK